MYNMDPPISKQPDQVLCFFLSSRADNNNNRLFLAASVLDDSWSGYFKNFTIWAGPCIFIKFINQPLLVMSVIASLKSVLTCSSASDIMIPSKCCVLSHWGSALSSNPV